MTRTNSRNPRSLTTCSIDGCDEPYRALGYCKPHWQRLNRYGNPLYVAKPHAVGEAMGCAVLTEKLVLSARKRVASGEISINGLAKEVGVSQSTLNVAVTGKSWAHLPGAVSPPGRTKLTEADVRKIRKLADELTVRNIADKYSMCVQAIRNIVNRQSWANVA